MHASNYSYSCAMWVRCTWSQYWGSAGSIGGLANIDVQQHIHMQRICMSAHANAHASFWPFGWLNLGYNCTVITVASYLIKNVT